ncbi:hypothetical protein FB45DRAFT_138882 [Roridomyces roridus]|uniref:DUF6534 domain-containing protein n=1 Tax=Roridomyces roridus TaxID=1738132 RepID=A0AAD7BHV6_9AGAR|nr:hypothetical protein FB45DRAFT_138882 [Roridomyces roridus]
MDSPAPSFNVTELSGPLIIGSWLNLALFGALSVQLYFYHLAFPNDRKSTKSLVYAIYALAMLSTFATMNSKFKTFGYGFADISILTKVDFHWVITPTVGGLLGFASQSFYAYRMYILSSRRLVPGLTFLLALTSIAGAFAVAVFVSKADNVIQLENSHVSISVGVWCGASAACDVLIAVCMTYYLTKADTGFARTHALISKLTRLIIETGSLTALVALATLILFFASEHIYYVTPADALPHIYAVTVLVVLNSRIRIVTGNRSGEISISGQEMCHTAGGYFAAAERVTITREVLSDASTGDQIELKEAATS